VNANLWPSLPDVDNPKEVVSMTAEEQLEIVGTDVQRYFARAEVAETECKRLRRILAAIADEARLQAAHLDEYGDRLSDEEREDRLALLFTFRRLANGVGPDGHEIK
jgi:hypothetical protein